MSLINDIGTGLKTFVDGVEQKGKQSVQNASTGIKPLDNVLTETGKGLSNALDSKGIASKASKASIDSGQAKNLADSTHAGNEALPDSTTGEKIGKAVHQFASGEFGDPALAIESGAGSVLGNVAKSAGQMVGDIGVGSTLASGAGAIGQGIASGVGKGVADFAKKGLTYGGLAGLVRGGSGGSGSDEVDEAQNNAERVDTTDNEVTNTDDSSADTSGVPKESPNVYRASDRYN